MRSFGSATSVALFAASLAVHATAFAQASPGYEATPQPSARELAPEALLAGALHTVAESVSIESFMGRFEVDSRFGKFRVAGVDMLRVRVRELAAIEALLQVERTAEFQQALIRSAQVPAQFVGSAITDPGTTVENVASGIGTVLGRARRLATTTANAIGDAATDVVSARPRAETAPGAATADDPAPPTFTGDPFGFNKARREWAQRLEIDPYTTNPVLRRELDSVARATFAGDLPVGLAIGVVAAPLQYATSFDTVVRDSVWNMPVIDLVARNESRLRAIGISGRPVRDFFRNRWFTPTLQTALVVALEQLPGVRGRDTVIASAATVQGEAAARSFIGAVRMLSQHFVGAPLSTIRMRGLVGIGKAANKVLVVAADLDYVWWNAEAAEFAASGDVASKRRTLLVSGLVSPRAGEELTRRGWEIRSGLRTAAAKQPG